MWLSWKAGFVLCGCLVAIAVAIRPGLFTGTTWRLKGLRDQAQARWLLTTRAVASEAAVVAGLYSIWQLAGTVSVMKVNGALERARWLWDIERWLHLPSEAAMQRLVLPHSWLVQ